MIVNSSHLTLNTLDRKITPLAAKLRFTREERISIRILSETNRSVEDFLDLLNTGYCVDLNRPEFKEGIMFLKTSGILTEERTQTILNSPIQETEIYRGAL